LVSSGIHIADIGVLKKDAGDVEVLRSGQCQLERLVVALPGNLTEDIWASVYYNDMDRLALQTLTVYLYVLHPGPYSLIPSCGSTENLHLL
jgi:hypothetical protein